MENPCKPDCPRRSATCHADCPDYAKFFARRAEKRQQEAVARRQESIMHDYKKQGKDRFLRKYWHSKRK